MKVGVYDHLAVCPSVCSPHPYELLNAWTKLNQTWYVYHGASALLIGVLHKSFPSVCVSLYLAPVSLLGNGSVCTFPLQLIHEGKKNCWTHRFLCGSYRIKGESVGLCIPLSLQGKCSVNTFLRQRRIIGIVVFYAVYVASKESRRLIHPRTSCYCFLHKVTKLFNYKASNEMRWS
jgi:hypothetical protein